MQVPPPGTWRTVDRFLERDIGVDAGPLASQLLELDPGNLPRDAFVRREKRLCQLDPRSLGEQQRRQIACLDLPQRRVPLVGPFQGIAALAPQRRPIQHADLERPERHLHVCNAVERPWLAQLPEALQVGLVGGGLAAMRPYPQQACHRRTVDAVVVRHGEPKHHRNRLDLAIRGEELASDLVLGEFLPPPVPVLLLERTFEVALGQGAEHVRVEVAVAVYGQDHVPKFAASGQHPLDALLHEVEALNLPIAGPADLGVQRQTTVQVVRHACRPSFGSASLARRIGRDFIQRLEMSHATRQHPPTPSPVPKRARTHP